MRKTLSVLLLAAATLSPTLASAGRAVAERGGARAAASGKGASTTASKPRAKKAAGRVKAANPRDPNRQGPRRKTTMVDSRMAAEDMAILEQLYQLPTAEELRDKALLPNLSGPLADPGAVLPAPKPGFATLLDGTPLDLESTRARQGHRAQQARAAVARMVPAPQVGATIRAQMKKLGVKPRTVVIDGGGPTGTLAAIHAYHLGLDVTLIESRQANTLPIIWNKRPQSEAILRLIDPELRDRFFAGADAGRTDGVAGVVRSGEYLQDGKDPIINTPDLSPMNQAHRTTAPEAVSNDPRTIAATPSTYQTQAANEVERYWDRAKELVAAEAIIARNEGRKPRFKILRGYTVTALPQDGDRRAVEVKPLKEQLQKLGTDGRPVVGTDGKPVVRPYDPAKPVPAGWAKANLPYGRAIKLGTPDDFLIAEGANSATRKLAGIKNIDVGPNTRYIAGFLKGKTITSLVQTGAGDRVVTGGVIRRTLNVLPSGRALRHIAINPENADGTWALPEVDGDLDFKDPASIAKYFGTPLSEKDAIHRYYAQEIAPMIGVKPEDIKPGDFSFGPGPFVLQSHVSGPPGADASNVITIGDANGNSHFLTSLGNVTGTGTHQLSLRHYWDALAHGADPRTQHAILFRRLANGSRAWIQAGLKEFVQAGGGNLGNEAVRRINDANGGRGFVVNQTTTRYDQTVDPTVNQQ
jgi:hypothetical protein